MGRVLILFVIGVFLVGLIGCGGGADSTDSQANLENSPTSNDGASAPSDPSGPGASGPPSDSGGPTAAGGASKGGDSQETRDPSKTSNPSAGAASGDGAGAKPKSTPMNSAQSAEKMIKRFMKIPSKDVDDEDLEKLAGLSEGLEQLTELNLSGSKVTETGMAHLEKFQAVVHLDLSRSNLSPDRLAIVKKMPNLQRLNLEGNRNIRDDTLDYISGLTNLTHVNLRETTISDEGLAHLSNLTKLVSLNLGYNQKIEGKGFTYLNKISLVELIVDRTRVVREGLNYIRGSKDLEVLNLSATNFSNKTMPYLSACTNLRILDLSSNRSVTDEGLMELKGLRKLEELNLSICPLVSNVGLSHLVGCKDLKLVTVNGTRCNGQIAAAMKAKIPALRIYPFDKDPVKVADASPPNGVGGSKGPGDPSVPSSTNPGGSANGGDTASKPVTFSEAAAQAFERGQDGDAFHYVYADFLTNDSSAQTQKMYWVEGLGLPKMAIRWAVGVVYSGPDVDDVLQGKLPLIGPKPPGGFVKKSDAPGKKNDKRGPKKDVPGRRDSDDPPSPVRVVADKALLVQYTGELGEKFLERLNTRREQEHYGALLKDVPMPGHILNRGDQLIPGVTMLGRGTIPQLLEQAKQRGLDAVALFDVHVTLGKDRQKNETKIRLVKVADGKEVRSTKLINNIKVNLDRENLKDGDKDPIEVAVDEFFEYSDQQFRTSELPKLGPQQAINRVKGLIDSNPENPLATLAEVRYYHTHNLLTDELRTLAFQRIIGDTRGKDLAANTFDSRKQAIEKWLPAGHKELTIVATDSSK